MHVIRQRFTNFVTSFKCSIELGRVLMAQLCKKRAVDIIPNLKFQISSLSIWDDRQFDCIFRIIVPLWGMIYFKVLAIVFYCI